MNPIFINISSSIPFLDIVSKYPPCRFIYRFRLTSITISTSIINLDNTILITCVRLNDCVKADVNEEEKNVMGIIHNENVTNWEQLKETWSWINIDLADHWEVQETFNVSFSFSKESIHDISKFNIYLKNGRNENIKFKEGEEKIPHFNFAIHAWKRWTQKNVNKNHGQQTSLNLNMGHKKIRRKLVNWQQKKTN